MTNEVKTFRERLAAAIAEGVVGRQELIARVAQMPVERLAALPPMAIAMLGPAGLAAVAGKRSDMTGLVPRASSTGKVVPTITPPPSPNRHPLLFPALLAGAILMAGLVVDAARPVLMSWRDPGFRPIRMSDWPRCPRLAPQVDGCIYRVGSTRLSLAGAAQSLGMGVEQLSSVNPAFASSPDKSLPAETSLVVWRGILRLKGEQ